MILFFYTISDKNNPVIIRPIIPKNIVTGIAIVDKILPALENPLSQPACATYAFLFLLAMLVNIIAGTKNMKNGYMLNIPKNIERPPKISYIIESILLTFCGCGCGL